MNNPRLAGRYAKSILDVAVEQNVVPAVYADMGFIQRICKSNADFVAVLKSPVIPSDKKLKVLEAITSDRISILSTMFVRLLVKKNREKYLPEIASAFIEQYNKLNNIHKVLLTTAAPVSEELQTMIVSKIKEDKQLENIELEVALDESLIGGFKLKLGDILVDASISRDLQDIKRQFLNNDYLRKLR